MRGEFVRVSTIAATAIAAALIPTQSAHSRATSRSGPARPPAPAGDRSHELSRSSLRLSRQGNGAAWRRLVPIIGHVKASSGQRGDSSGHTRAMVLRMGSSIGSIGRWTAPCALEASDGRMGRPGRLRATFLMRSRSLGAIGRPRATPVALPTAGRSMDGPDGRTAVLLSA